MKSHFLLVNHHLDELKILTAALYNTSVFCKCTWATGAMHALEMLRYLQPDFIVVDYHMPEMNGIECIQAIRQLPTAQDIPLVLYASHTDTEMKNSALAAGATGCLKKNADSQVLSTALQLLFSKEMAY